MQATEAKQSVWPLLAWVLLPFTAAAMGAWFRPDGWFAALAKPEWNPPSWLFGPVWTALYLLMGVAAALVWRTGRGHARQRALAAFCVQLVVNALWTPVFFGLHSPGGALAVIVLLWLLIIVTLLQFWRVHRFAAALLVPYLAWVSFAMALNAAIWQMNS